MFDKKVFYEKCDQWLATSGWENRSYLIPDIMAKHKLEEYPYVPRYYVEKDGVKFFVAFFQKGDWSDAKVFNNERGTGLDWYKYKFLEALQTITNIQVGLVMWNEESDLFIFRQLDQLAKPIKFFSGYGCRAYHLKKLSLAFKCYKCWQNEPRITDECIHQRKQIKKKKKREMAMWSIKEFSDEFAVQTKLF